MDSSFLAHTASASFKVQSSRGRWQKEVTRMTSNDRLLVDQRWRNNQSKLEFVTNALQAFFHSKKLTVTLLKPLAKKIIQQTSGIYLDRLAKRNRHALLCWFCEKWNFIVPYIQSSKICSPHQHENSSDSPMTNYSSEPLSSPISSVHCDIEECEENACAEDLCDIFYLLNHH